MTCDDACPNQFKFPGAELTREGEPSPGVPAAAKPPNPPPCCNNSWEARAKAGLLVLVGAVGPKAKALGVLEAFEYEVHDAAFKLPLNAVAANWLFKVVFD